MTYHLTYLVKYIDFMLNEYSVMNQCKELIPSIVIINSCLIFSNKRTSETRVYLEYCILVTTL